MNGQNASLSPGSEPSLRSLLLVIMGAPFLTTFTGSMINVVLPVIRAEFGASPATIGWVATGYLLAYAIGVPIIGGASDRYGIRRLFALGLTGFAAGGIVCALAPSLSVLILGRTLQGAAGAAVPALATVAVARTLPSGQRGGALGLMASAVGIGSSVGPVVGGALGDWLGWRGLFAIPITLALVLVPLALRSLPEGRTADARRLDAVGALLLALSAGFFLLGITQGQTTGFRAAYSWGSFLTAMLAAAALAWRTGRVPDPFVPPTLFRNRGYVTALCIGPMGMFVNLSVLMLVPLLIVEVNGLPSSAAGVALTPQAVAQALVAPLAGRLSDRLGVRHPLLMGVTIMIVTVAGLSTWAGASPAAIAILMAVLGTGFACVQSPASNAAANALREEDVGTGMGLFSGSGFLMAAAGPAISGALLAARQEAAAPAVHPFYGLHAAAFSDAFLALLVPLAVAFVAVWLLPTESSGRTSERPTGEEATPTASARRSAVDAGARG